MLAEALAVTLVGVGGLLLSARFNLYERFLVWTRGLERYNVDEAPFALFLLVLTLAVFAYRRWREYLAEAAKRQQLESTAAKAHERLIDAVESMPAGVMLFDAGDRLVLANSKTAEFFPELARHLRPGVTFADLARVGLAGGCFSRNESEQRRPRQLAAGGHRCQCRSGWRLSPASETPSAVEEPLAKALKNCCTWLGLEVNMLFKVDASNSSWPEPSEDCVIP